MSLVAKKGAALNRRGGALVLSRNTGAWAQLHRWALGIDPTEVDGTASALRDALKLRWRERWTRAEGLRSVVEQSSVDSWMNDQLADLDEMRLHRRGLRSA
jgi:trehalose 6-phosphate synthase